MRKTVCLLAAIMAMISCQKEETGQDMLGEEISILDIDVSKLNKEATRYYTNMADFVSLTSSNIDSDQAFRLKSANSNEQDSTINPILEEFINLEIEDDDGTIISFFDMSIEDREEFMEQWIIANADDMTPKLEDSAIGKELEEYIQLQNDAFDEAMKGLVDELDSTMNLKSAYNGLTSNYVYERISSKVQARVMEKSESYAKEYLAANPEISNTLKSSDPYPDYVDPNSVLSQLRKHADRGNILINLPGSVWLSQYLFYNNPGAIAKYVGVGKYPPGHVAIVKQTKANLPTFITEDGVTISAQNGSGVRDENVFDHWDCKAHLCYVKDRKWKKWRYRLVYPNADKVIEYAESKIGKPYCKGWDFVTAKSRRTCFICTTITWRSFNNEGFNIHRLAARWMPTIAPSDIYLSSHVKRKHKIK
jgi:hypothetical protein